MSENAVSIQKRVLFADDTSLPSGLVYPKSPHLRSQKIAKETVKTHIPTSSGQPSLKSRHKSPISRHPSPHRAISKKKICWGGINSIRKTQSSALPSLTNAPWSRGTAASTPDLKIENRRVHIEPRSNENYNRRRYRNSSCYYNCHLIFVILNCIILAAGIMYLCAGVTLTIYKEIALIIVDYRVYAISLILLYSEAIILLVISLFDICLVHRGSRKKHLCCLLLAMVFTVSLGIAQGIEESNIQNNVKKVMLSSITSKPDLYSKNAWDYFHKTWNCCGSEENFDWCEKDDSLVPIVNSTNLLESYNCHLPVSCCKNTTKNETVFSTNFNHPLEDLISCSILPTPWNTYRAGCRAHVLLEMRYIGKIFRTISFGTGFILFLSSMTTGIIFTYF